MIQLFCENKNVLALTEDQLIINSMDQDLVGKDINLIYTNDELLKWRVYIFIKYKYLDVTLFIVAMF